jgi:integrase
MSTYRKPSFGYIDQLPSQRFRARYKDDLKQFVTIGTFATWHLANEALQDAYAKIRLGLIGTPLKRSTRTLVEFTEWYYDGPANLAIRTKEVNLSFLRKHVFPMLGGLPLSKITVPMIDTWWSHAGRTMTPMSRRNAYFALRGILRYAVRIKEISENPCQVEGASADVSVERPELTFHDMLAIIEKMPPLAAVATWVAFGAHLRVGELVALQARDVNLETGEVRVARQIVEAKGGATMTGTKNKSNEVVVLFPVALEILKLWLIDHPAEGSDYLFRYDNGKNMGRAYIQQRWVAARTEAGLPQFHLHDVRHTGLGMVEETGLGIKAVQARARHKTTAAALKYMHNRIGAIEGIVGQVDEEIRKRMGDAA